MKSSVVHDNPGTFVISLDFEIHWGVSDHRTIESYQENLRNVPAVVGRTLDLFRARQIHATWATVGMLYCRNREELEMAVGPPDRPTYQVERLSNYRLIPEIGWDEADDPYHFASSLVNSIASVPGQEMATHTFSHFYCEEPGQTPAQFACDLAAAIRLGADRGQVLQSIVFPRNQYSEDYLAVCARAGIRIYRGNFPSALYRPEAKSRESKLKRLGRLLDAYLPLNGSRVVSRSGEAGLINIPASAFLRPFNRKLAFLESLRLGRIMREMTVAAKTGKIYHLWWHPHNFGANMDRNFSNLETLLAHYQTLKAAHGMRSMTMAEAAAGHQGMPNN